MSLCTASGALNCSLFRHGLGGRDRIVRSLCSFLPLSTRKHVSDRYLVLFLVLRVICSEATPQGKKQTKLQQTLLNGNNICMVSVFSSIRIPDPGNNLPPSLYRGAMDLTNNLPYMYSPARSGSSLQTPVPRGIERPGQGPST